MDQQGYIKNRLIGFNIRQIQDIIDYSDYLNLDAAILFLDFKKAFDTVEHSFLFLTLTKFGFNNSFITWIKTLYNNSSTCILNNGWKSDNLNPERGIRQGCPISSLLFIIIAEILAINIRNNINLKGINVQTPYGNKSIKLTQLADDTTLFLASKAEVKIALNIIEQFGKFSGLKLNRNKTEGMWIGALKQCKDIIEGINWSNKPIKALGVYFSNNKEECELLNWSSKIETCEKLLRNWSKRNLSLFGKIKIIKTLILPKFVYLAQTLVVPKDILKKINTLIYTFLWGGKREKIKRTTLIGNKLEGGIEMPDPNTFFKSLKIKWVKTLINNEKANWKILPEYFMKSFGDKFLIFYMNIDNIKKLPNLNALSPFYEDLVQCWIEVSQESGSKLETFESIRKQVIWGNKNLTINNKCLVFKNWIKSNIIFINDILNENGEIHEQFILTKLADKSNWISEISKLKSCVPNKWKYILNTETSIKSKVKTDFHLVICLPQGKLINLQDTTNRQLYSKLLKVKFSKPYIHTYTDRHF